MSKPALVPLPLKWELVEETAPTRTMRLAVPGGWIYRIDQFTVGFDGHRQLLETDASLAVFVPDPHSAVR